MAGWAGPAIAIGSNVLGGIMGQDAQQDAYDEAMAKQQQAINKTADVREQVFQDVMGLQKPFIDLGATAVPAVRDLIFGKTAGSTTPAAQARSSMARDFMTEKFGGRMSEPLLSQLSKRVGAEESINQKQRLFRLMDLGLGGAGGVAGAGQRTSNALTQAMLGMQQMRGQGDRAAAQGRQEMFANTLQGVGSIPSYMALQDYMRTR